MKYMKYNQLKHKKDKKISRHNSIHTLLRTLKEKTRMEMELKFYKVMTVLHGITSLKTIILISTAIITSHVSHSA